MKTDFINPEIILTEDGSHSLYSSSIGESYHSKHGAIGETMHVFINAGFNELLQLDSIKILEIGFGAGLNAFITLIESCQKKINIHYHAIEPFPVGDSVFTRLNYPELVAETNSRTLFIKLHDSPWNTEVKITESFLLKKMMTNLEDCVLPPDYYNLVYFDAFSPDAQPGLWSAEIFRKLYQAMRPNGFFVTYSAKGTVRRNLKSVGFRVERLPGSKGKREMLRAFKS